MRRDAELVGGCVAESAVRSIARIGVLRVRDYPGGIYVRRNALDLESDAQSIFRNTWSRLLAAVEWLEKDAQGARRHSDKEKFRSDLNRPESCKMSERLLKTLRKFADFQAEYEGSIPFTRSKNDFNDLDRYFRLPF